METGGLPSLNFKKKGETSMKKIKKLTYEKLDEVLAYLLEKGVQREVILERSPALLERETDKIRWYEVSNGDKNITVEVVYDYYHPTNFCLNKYGNRYSISFPLISEDEEWRF